MTDKEEIALALNLWRFMRGKCYQGDTSHTLIWNSLQMMEDVSEKAIELAKQCGVKEEFFQIMFELPLMEITVKEIEPWKWRGSDSPTKKPKRYEKKKFISGGQLLKSIGTPIRPKPSSKPQPKKSKNESTDKSPKS